MVGEIFLRNTINNSAGAFRREASPALQKKLRWLLGFFLVLISYDGSLRKWGFQSSEQIIFLFKDVILFSAVMISLSEWQKSKTIFPKSTINFFKFYAFWLLIELLNLNSPNLLVGIWGLKSHILYAGLPLILPLAYNRLFDIFRVIGRLYPILVIPICIVALIQVGAGGDASINQLVRGGEEGIAYFGEESLVRVAGTFSYIAGMAAFLNSAVVLGIGLILAGNRSNFFLSSLLITLIVLPVTGSRGVIYNAVGTLLVITLIALQVKLVKTKDIKWLVIGLAVFLSISFMTQETVWQAFQQRAEGAKEDGPGRITGVITEIYDFYDTAGLFGYGTGTANTGSIALIGNLPPFYWFPPGVGGESEPGRIMLELGLIGYLISMGFKISLLILSYKLAKQGITKLIQVVGVMSTPIMLLGVYAGTGVFAATYTSVTYWFIVAILGMANYEQSHS